MKIILFVFLLNIKSSYLQNTEEPSNEPADTVQFVLVNGQAWRIKTFALDHDVHVWSLGGMDPEKFEEVAASNTEKHYGDVLIERIRFETDADFHELALEVTKSKLGGALEIGKDDSLAFWVESAGIYKTKSSPQ